MDVPAVAAAPPPPRGAAAKRGAAQAAAAAAEAADGSGTLGSSKTKVWRHASVGGGERPTDWRLST